MGNKFKTVQLKTGEIFPKSKMMDPAAVQPSSSLRRTLVLQRNLQQANAGDIRFLKVRVCYE